MLLIFHFNIIDGGEVTVAGVVLSRVIFKPLPDKEIMSHLTMQF